VNIVHIVTLPEKFFLRNIVKVKQKNRETPFQRSVRAVVRSIKKGETRSYGEVARAAGYPGAARAVGVVMKNNYDLTVPCHRVICADGALGGYNRGGIQRKAELLKEENMAKLDTR
jgi:methylated-DNA-[protein]-cysteine S-methyltransferase